MEAAYDVRNPNGTGRRQQGDPVLHLFRLYRKLTAPSPGDLPTAGGVLGDIQSAVRTARTFLETKILGPLQGRILVKEIKVPLIIEDLDEVPDVRSNFTYVRGGPPGENFFIDLPFRNARGVTHFRISGRTFWTPILVDGVPMDGDSALIELQKLIEDYFYPPDGGATADYELYWIDLNAPVSAEEPFGASEWWIHPPRHGLRIRQNARRPFTRFFSLEFLGLRSNRDLAKAEDGLLGSLFGTSTLLKLLRLLHLDALVDAAIAVLGVLHDIQGLLDDLNAVVVAVTDVITGVREFIQLSIAKVRGLLVSIQELIGRVEEAYQLARDIPSLVDEQVRLLQQSFPGLVDDPNQAFVLNNSLRRTRQFVLALLADPSRFTPPITSAGAAARTIAVQIQPGTTLERLARDSNVTTTALIEVNGLAYPFIDSRVRTERIVEASASARAGAASPSADPVATLREVTASADRALAWATTRGPSTPPATVETLRAAAAAARGAYDRARSGGPTAATPAELAALGAAEAAAAALASAEPSLPNVLYAGDPIRLPQSQRGPIPSIAGIEGGRLNLVAAVGGRAVSEEERLFGIDLYLNDAGHLEWDPDTFDLRLDRGLAHMRNVLVRYARLPFGALRFAPRVGNYAWNDLARWQTPADNRFLAYGWWLTLNQDPRVRRIRSVRADSYGGAAFIRSSAELINGQELPDLRVPLTPVRMAA